jgi:hypothetical protein
MKDLTGTTDVKVKFLYVKESDYRATQRELKEANERIFALEKFTMMQNSDATILEQIISAKKNNEKLADKISELEKLAEDWMNCYQKLKDKYEPEIFVTSGELKEGEK